MRHYTDIAVFGRDNSLKLLVEVKSKPGASPQWAAKLRRNMHAHGRTPNAPFFLLALPDRFYLWKGARHEQVEPNYEGDAASLLQPHREGIHVPGRPLSEHSLELVVASWLDQLVSIDEDARLPRDHWLRVSGLLDAIRGGSVEVQALAER